MIRIRYPKDYKYKPINMVLYLGNYFEKIFIIIAAVISIVPKNTVITSTLLIFKSLYI